MQHMMPTHWSTLRPKLEEVFKQRTRDEWCELLEGTDVCFAPVLSATEAFEHPHNVARKSFVEIGGVTQHVPAPRFSRTEPAVPEPTRERGADTETVLRECGIEPP